MIHIYGLYIDDIIEKNNYHSLICTHQLHEAVQPAHSLWMEVKNQQYQDPGYSEFNLILASGLGGKGHLRKYYLTITQGTSNRCTLEIKASSDFTFHFRSPPMLDALPGCYSQSGSFLMLNQDNISIFVHPSTNVWIPVSQIQIPLQSTPHGVYQPQSASSGGCNTTLMASSVNKLFIARGNGLFMYRADSGAGGSISLRTPSSHTWRADSDIMSISVCSSLHRSSSVLLVGTEDGDLLCWKTSSFSKGKGPLCSEKLNADGSSSSTLPELVRLDLVSLQKTPPGASSTISPRPPTGSHASLRSRTKTTDVPSASTPTVQQHYTPVVIIKPSPKTPRSGTSRSGTSTPRRPFVAGSTGPRRPNATHSSPQPPGERSDTTPRRPVVVRQRSASTSSRSSVSVIELRRRVEELERENVKLRQDLSHRSPSTPASSEWSPSLTGLRVSINDNACYIRSVIQALRHLPMWRAIKDSKNPPSLTKSPVSRALYDISRGQIDIIPIMESLKLPLGSMGDVVSTLAMIVRSVLKEPQSQATKLVHSFLISTIVRTEYVCGHSKEITRQAPIVTARSGQSPLISRISGGLLRQYDSNVKCQQCQKKTSARIVKSLTDLPQVMIVYQPRQAAHMLSAHTSPPFPLLFNNPMGIEGVWHLQAAICHAEAHYTCVGRRVVATGEGVSVNSGVKSQWWMFDEDRVTLMLDDSISAIQSLPAVVLFYVKGELTVDEQLRHLKHENELLKKTTRISGQDIDDDEVTKLKHELDAVRKQYHVTQHRCSGLEQQLSLMRSRHAKAVSDAEKRFSPSSYHTPPDGVKQQEDYSVGRQQGSVGSHHRLKVRSTPSSHYLPSTRSSTTSSVYEQ
eukprot:gnl/Dysnectes_brevis/4354_a5807_402.p1 GENE.gnl/Dysnectes_brevis/4354_a5807_402~~gnl/Dysnectes_brevis/4354_a5807_402.p1  ORF type:complete len:995 (-),score=100.78 gnl/Dysnectes_brevis/4354_a5807_402:484-3048(-)